MPPRTSSSHNNSPASNQLTMSSSVTNSPAGLMNIVNSSPHSNINLQTNSPHTSVQNNNSSPQSGDELIGTQLNIQSENNILINSNNLNNSSNTNLTASNENGLNQLVLNNQSPINTNNTSPLSNSSTNLPNNSLIKQEDLKQEMYNQNSTNNQTLNGLILSNSTPSNQNLNNLSPNSSIKNENLNSSINNSSSNLSSSSNLAQQPLTTSSVQNSQWTGIPARSNNFNTTGRYQATNQFGSSGNQTINSNPSTTSSSTFQSASINLNSQPQNLLNENNLPYLDYNLNTNYTGSSMLNQSNAPCTVPNMFTAAAVAAAANSNSGASKSSSNSNNSSTSEFPFNSNNLNKKYLNNSLDPNSNSNLQITSGLEHNSTLDQTLFYGTNPATTNSSTPLNKSTTSTQSSLSSKPLPHQTSSEFSTSLANNYANFAPNSNSYWQPGYGPQQMNITNGSNNMYQPKQMQSPGNLQSHQLPHHTPPSSGGLQLDEASQSSTPNSQLDELRSDTPNTKLNGLNNQANGQTYLTSTINGVSNNSSSNSSTGSMASSANSSTNGTSLNSNGSKGMPVYSFPPTPNTTIGSPGASVMSGFYDEYETASNTTWSKNHRLDGLMKLYEISNEPGRKIFLDKLVQFNNENGVTLNSCPSINKGLIDLYRLYTCVKERGGFLQTTKSKLWKECATICNIKQQPTSAYILRKQYIKHLLPFECKYDLNGADLAEVVAQTENANRKKRKNKNGNEPTPIQQASQQVNLSQQTQNQLNASNSVLPAGVNNKDLPPINQPINNLHQTLNNQIPNRHLSMQSSAYSAGPNSITISNNLMSTGPSFQPGYNYNNNNYNNNSLSSNYMPSSGSNNMYPNMYNQQSFDYQSKLNHQLSSTQPPAQFFNPSNGNPQIMNNSSSSNQPNGLVSSSIQQQNTQIHNLPNNLPSNNLPSNNQQINNLNNNNLNQQFYSQQSNQNSMYNGQINNNNLINGPNLSNEFYSTNYSTNPNPNLIHSNQMYAGSNGQQINSISQYNDDMLKYNNATNRQELNSSQSSLTSSSNQLNTSNNQYYNGHADTPNNNYSTSIYSNRANGYQQLNGYTYLTSTVNGVSNNSSSNSSTGSMASSANSSTNGYTNGTILDSNNSFDKNGNSNLIDFHTSTIKSDSTNLDSYLSDPFSYEPESKRFHATNC